MVHGGGGGESVLDRLVFGAPEQAGAACAGDAAAWLCAVPAAGPAAAATLRTVTAGLIHRRWWGMIRGRPKGLPPTSKKNDHLQHHTRQHQSRHHRCLHGDHRNAVRADHCIARAPAGALGTGRGSVGPAVAGGLSLGLGAFGPHSPTLIA